MLCHRLTNLPRAQLVAVPLNLHSRLPTIVFYFFATVRLKNFPPRKIERVVIVSDVHHLFANEFFFYRRINLREDSAAVGDRRFTSSSGRLYTEKADDHGPLSRVGHLVMKRNRLMSGIMCRRIDFSAHLISRCRTI